MSFSLFPVSRLEALIGPNTLKKVETILPAFDTTIDVDSIYTKKNLLQILYAFIDSNDFNNKELRKEFLTYQQEPNINTFCDLHDINKALSFDEKVNKIVAKNWSNVQFCESFCNHFDLPLKFIPEKKIDYPNLELLKKCDTPFKVLKDYQSSISFRAIDKLKYRNNRFIIQMPTGSGKTRTAMEIIADSINSNKDSCFVFWLVYSEELCEQAV